MNPRRAFSLFLKPSLALAGACLRLMSRLLIPSICLFLSVSLGVAELPPRTNTPVGTNTWTAWRGDGTGVSPEKNLPLTWSATEHVRWSAKVPGYGWSSPVVAAGRIFVTTAICDQQTAPAPRGPGGGEPAPDVVFRWEVHCFDAATGHPLWKQLAAEHKPTTGTHISNTYASETPVTDGERVYAYFGMVGVYCYDINGKLLWTRDLGAFKTFANWGSSSSPAFDGERLFILCDNEEKSFLVALDKKTGKDVWRIARPERSTWSTPILWHNSQRTELVCMGSDYIRAYDPATGREIWRLASEKHLAPAAGASDGAAGNSAGPPGPPPSRGPSTGGTAGPPSRPGGGGPGGSGGGGKAASGGCKASPVAGGDLLYVGMSSKSHGTELGPMWAVKAGANGDISLHNGETSNAGVAWFRDDAGPHFTSALVQDGRLYVFPPHDRGVLSCFDAKTGQTIYAEPLQGAAGFKSSPCFADGKIYCTDERGTTFVIESGPKFKVLAKNAVNEMSWASSAIASGAIFVRTTEHLLCIGGASPAMSTVSTPNRQTTK
jgi:outer membrane protein assembly factor BamB